jgi:hypothetical protein
MSFLKLKGRGKVWTGSYTKRLWKTQFNLGKSQHKCHLSLWCNEFHTLCWQFDSKYYPTAFRDGAVTLKGTHRIEDW